MNLDAADIRIVFEIIGHLREIGARPSIWKPQMLSALCAVLPARLGVCLQHDTRRHASEAHRCNQQLVVASAQGCLISTSGESGGPPTDLLVAVAREPAELSIRGAIPINTVLRSPDRENPIHSPGDMIHSQRRYPRLFCSQDIYLLRGSSDPPFSGRESSMLELFHTELKLAINNDEKRRLDDGDVDMPRLSPRLAETLMLLAEGLSEKQAAGRMGCRPSTVHDYVKQLHLRFGVNSRGELLARYAGLRWRSRGKLLL
jgi:DNA-binding CsgD family transcriptional regulator